MIRYQNLSLNRLPLSINNGEIFEFCNFTQKIADTEIFDGASELIFRNCNLVNCIVPDGSIVENCNSTRKSFCSHLHENWDLPLCAEDCEHSNNDEVWIDGELIETIYYYEDKTL